MRYDIIQSFQRGICKAHIQIGLIRIPPRNNIRQFHQDELIHPAVIVNFAFSLSRKLPIPTPIIAAF